MHASLLVVVAHPDDEVLLAGGVLARCAALDLPTAVICLTRGELGPIADPGAATRATLGDVREQELAESCRELGVSWIRCYRRQDGHLRWSGSSVPRQLARVIDALTPEVVITFGEDGLYYHSDHIATYAFTRRAVERAEHACRLYRSIWPKTEMQALEAELGRRGLPTTSWGLDVSDFGVDEVVHPAQVVIDVRPYLTQKMRAFRAHRTQLEPDHALAALPGDLLRRYLGFERFVPVELAKPTDGSTDLLELLTERGAGV